MAEGLLEKLKQDCSDIEDTYFFNSITFLFIGDEEYISLADTPLKKFGTHNHRQLKLTLNLINNNKNIKILNPEFIRSIENYVEEDTTLRELIGENYDSFVKYVKANSYK